MQTFRDGETGHDSCFGVITVFSGVIGIERVFNGCGGNLLFVFRELALFCAIVFRVIIGPNLIFALRLLSPMFNFPILRSMLPKRRPLSKLSISSNWEKMSNEKCNCQYVSFVSYVLLFTLKHNLKPKPGICSFSM